MSSSLPQFNKAQAMQIRVITKKLRLNARHIAQLEAAKREGVSGVEALANVLGVRPGEDPVEYLRKKLSPREYEILANVLDLASDGNPLRQEA